jgi:hypothetical protein
MKMKFTCHSSPYDTYLDRVDYPLIIGCYMNRLSYNIFRLKKSVISYTVNVHCTVYS